MPSVECEQEFEVLESIYKEIEIVPETPDGGSLVSILLYPKSAGDMESRYVTVKLEFHLPSTYPETLPKIEMRNPRGLSQEQLEELERGLESTRAEFSGSAMLFQLIDLVQDYLTVNNRPSAECPICLCSFTDFDVFYTPACFHHYHSHCLGLHLHNLINSKKEASESQVPNSPVELLCPVCRVTLDRDIDIDKLLASPPAAEDDIVNVNGQGLGIPESDRRELDALFQKQKEQGGIIDLSEDCIRLLRISDHVTTGSSAEGQGSEVTEGPPVALGPPPSGVRSTEGSHRVNGHAQGSGGAGYHHGSGGGRVRAGRGHHYKYRERSRGGPRREPFTRTGVRGHDPPSTNNGGLEQGEGKLGAGSMAPPTARKKQWQK